MRNRLDLIALRQVEHHAPRERAVKRSIGERERLRHASDGTRGRQIRAEPDEHPGRAVDAHNLHAGIQERLGDRNAAWRVLLLPLVPDPRIERRFGER